MALPGLPASKRGINIRIETENWLAPENEGKSWRVRKEAGGGYEFTPFALPLPARAALAVKMQDAEVVEHDTAMRERQDIWTRYDALPNSLKARAEKAHRIVMAVETLVDAGCRKKMAVMQIAKMEGVGTTTIMNWYRDVRGFNKCDWLAALAPHYAKRAEQVECPTEAWDILKADYLRLEEPTFTACMRRLEGLAKKRGWQLPSSKTLKRRMDTLPPELLTLCRKGEQALKVMFPAQKRDHAVFHALEAVNADGHKFDVFVKWIENGKEMIVRPVLVGFQDIYSGKILSWRVDVSENKECVRLAFGDMVAKYGVPKKCWLDNGRNFASKWLTGGVQNRYRFKVRDDEPMGILPLLGVEVHWATPYSGRSKPIERAWRDLAGDLAKHPRFAGAYTGNTVTSKPENYGSTAVPLEVFLEVVAEGIREHNARLGRRSDVCQGKRSFDDVFTESYAQAANRGEIVTATKEQQRMCLMAAESVTVARRDGVIVLADNRYWADFLHQHRGTSVVVRFDPQAMHDDLHVYRIDGTYLGAAPCVEKAGFNDKTAAQAAARQFKAFRKLAKDLRAAEVRLDTKQLADVFISEDVPEENLPETKVVRPFRPAPLVAHGNAAVAVDPDFLEDDDEEVSTVIKMRQFMREQR
ncbi:MAG: Mu transposase C-terminal domain-containing protein [Acetobacter fabarum]|uniref:transposase domain-containing protein n=1 Tax=Acetobacter fabarum TaxID=483199 RepID=UPI00242E4F8E|nr:transposase domain-containing protein [Acetobacter fabarum]MCH4025025.1 Mu transposase C-terminal domain-containing protein [Acetobacter fabarum]MCI1297621.1 Mu transposase C-terminal domain-containing protein [Acetobacter fabarum]MCI1759104.1 Mu transposase C-terminal domain-containing protein [Acetobacter fabarum]